MNEHTTAHRANAPALKQRTDELVRILGKCIRASNGEATIDAEGPITVHCSSATAMFEEGVWYDIVAKVLDDNTVKAHVVLKSDKALNPDLIRRVVEAEEDHPTLF